VVRFRDDVKLDTSQVEDVRGRGPMLGIPGGGLTVGGGGLGLVALLVYVLITVLSGSSGLGGPLGNLDGTTVSRGMPGQVLGQECQTGADANRLEDCRIVGDICNRSSARRAARSPRPTCSHTSTGTTSRI
jgi:hypothetical protein